MLWSQKWIRRTVKTMGQSDAKINRTRLCTLGLRGPW